MPILWKIVVLYEELYIKIFFLMWENMHCDILWKIMTSFEIYDMMRYDKAKYEKEAFMYNYDEVG